MNVLFDGLGDALRDYREERGLTRRDAAKAARVASSSWGKWERGRVPQAKMLPNILGALGCTEAELWHRKAEIEWRHYRRSQVSQMTAEFPERFAHLQTARPEDMDEIEQTLRTLFKRRRISH